MPRSFDFPASYRQHAEQVEAGLLNTPERALLIEYDKHGFPSVYVFGSAISPRESLSALLTAATQLNALASN